MPNDNGLRTKTITEDWLRRDAKTGQDVPAHAEITVTEADVRAGFRRYRMTQDIYKKVYHIQDGQPKLPPAGVDEDEFNLHTLTYTNLITATLSAKGDIPWPMSFEQFLHLRQALWDKWSDAVAELNPQWYPTLEVLNPSPKAEPLPTKSIGESQPT